MLNGVSTELVMLTRLHTSLARQEIHVNMSHAYDHSVCTVTGQINMQMVAFDSESFQSVNTVLTVNTPIHPNLYSWNIRTCYELHFYCIHIQQELSYVPGTAFLQWYRQI